jgi:hypothetical protein
MTVTGVAATTRWRLPRILDSSRTSDWLRTRGWWRVVGLEEICTKIQSVCARESLGLDEVIELIGDEREGSVPPHIGEAVKRILAGGVPDEPRAAVLVAERLEERFGERLDSARLSGPLERVSRRFVLAFGVLLGLGCFYIVVGGLLEGKSERFGSLPGPVALAMFMVALAFLGLFEALHTSGTQLRLADLRGLARDLPRACESNRRLRDDNGMERFLAGRQIVVVITVFLVAGLSSFPSMGTLPFIGVPVPGALAPIIELGIPGALVVLWVAQLAPQFYATRNSLRLMNTRAAGWALDLAFALEAVGLAQPSRWVPRRGTAKRIPLSAGLRWDQDAEERDGDGLVSINRRWLCGPDRSQARVASSTSVRRVGHAAVVDSNLVLPAAPSSLQLAGEIRTVGGSSRPVAPTDHLEEPLPTGDRRFRKLIVPAVGAFAQGECAQASVEANYEVPVARDSVPVERPARFFLWRLGLTEEPLHFPHVRLRLYRVGEGLGELTAIGEEVRLYPSRGSDGLPVVSYSHSFPPPNTLFVFDWEVVWS